jgi:hypothetical protein
MKRLFCWLYHQWLSKAVDSNDDLLVRLIDAAAGSECKYCMGMRLLAMGLGSGLVFVGGWVTWLGLVLMVLAILMTLGEKYWLCEVKK